MGAEDLLREFREALLDWAEKKRPIRSELAQAAAELLAGWGRKWCSKRGYPAAFVRAFGDWITAWPYDKGLAFWKSYNEGRGSLSGYLWEYGFRQAKRAFVGETPALPEPDPPEPGGRDGGRLTEEEGRALLEVLKPARRLAGEGRQLRHSYGALLLRQFSTLLDLLAWLDGQGPLDYEVGVLEEVTGRRFAELEAELRGLLVAAGAARADEKPLPDEVGKQGDLAWEHVVALFRVERVTSENVRQRVNRFRRELERRRFEG